MCWWILDMGLGPRKLSQSVNCELELFVSSFANLDPTDACKQPTLWGARQEESSATRAETRFLRYWRYGWKNRFEFTKFETRWYAMIDIDADSCTGSFWSVAHTVFRGIEIHSWCHHFPAWELARPSAQRFLDQGNHSYFL